MESVRAEELLKPPNDGSVANLVGRSVRAFPDRLALEGDGETRTYAELDERVRAIAAGLAERADPGDRVGLYLPNGGVRRGAARLYPRGRRRQPAQPTVTVAGRSTTSSTTPTPWRCSPTAPARRGRY
jgi:acyl-CoA synthetase (AMP-forming)/AMP-acid ligase II